MPEQAGITRSGKHNTLVLEARATAAARSQPPLQRGGPLLTAEPQVPPRVPEQKSQHVGDTMKGTGPMHTQGKRTFNEENNNKNLPTQVLK